MKKLHNIWVISTFQLLAFLLVVSAGCQSLPDLKAERRPGPSVWRENGYQWTSLPLILWIEWLELDGGKTHHLLLDSNSYFAAFRPDEYTLEELERNSVRRVSMAANLVIKNLREWQFDSENEAADYLMEVTFDDGEARAITLRELDVILNKTARRTAPGTWHLTKYKLGGADGEIRTLIAAFIANGFNAFGSPFSYHVQFKRCEETRK